jgi:hypothetical protein
MKRVLLVLSLIGQITFVSYGQQKIIIDGDIVYLRDSLNGEFILLDSIEKIENNENTFWIQYDRRPGVDPWIKGYRGDDKYAGQTPGLIVPNNLNGGYFYTAPRQNNYLRTRMFYIDKEGKIYSWKWQGL